MKTILMLPFLFAAFICNAQRFHIRHCFQRSSARAWRDGLHSEYKPFHGYG